MLVGPGILGTFLAPPGSMEGFRDTTTPIAVQIRGYPEIVPQALLLSALLCYRVNHPGKWRMSWLLSVFILARIASLILGILAGKRSSWGGCSCHSLEACPDAKSGENALFSKVRVP